MKQIITADRKVVILNDDGTWKYAPGTGSNLDQFRTRKVPSGIVEATIGMFSRLGIRVIETGEQFTCIHHGDRVEFIAGIDAANVDFTVEVYAFQLERLAAQISAGRLDDLEQFRITRTLFTAARGKRQLMAHPLMSNPILRQVIRGKNLMHVRLISPDPGEEPDAVYTVLFINREWLVIPGLYGTPKRVLRVPVSEVIALQKNLFAGMKSGDIKKWLKIAKWYVEWRKRVEVPS